MKPVQDTEEFVRRGKLHATTSLQMDRRVLDASMAAMAEGLAGRGPSARRPLLRHWAIGFIAAAAVIAVACTLLMVQPGPHRLQPQPINPVNAQRSPAQGLSARSLRRAYLRGGIEAVDQQAQQAFDQLGHQPSSVSLRELLTESNGV